ncbi:MAG: RecX family transcriptional regulator, partial [Kordiimonadaceae bacterium]|nr:RecX family transcriptional regulator [Kordiimonadaceae bacterium]
ERKVRRRNEESAAPTTEQLGWIDAVADKCVEYGYVDDVNYAKQRFTSLLRKGKPLRVISHDLAYKGVPQDIVTELMAHAAEDPDKDLNLVAAAAYVRRRRFGPYRRVAAAEDKVEKEKAAMLRAGFPYRMVEQVLASSEEEIIKLLV